MAYPSAVSEEIQKEFVTQYPVDGIRDPVVKRMIKMFKGSNFSEVLGNDLKPKASPHRSRLTIRVECVINTDVPLSNEERTIIQKESGETPPSENIVR